MQWLPFPRGEHSTRNPAKADRLTVSLKPQGLWAECQDCLA
jgi:hypothetical protein